MKAKLTCVKFSEILWVLGGEVMSIKTNLCEGVLLYAK